MLGKIADFYEFEVDATVKAMASITEAQMIVVVGGIVGGIIVAIYLPMLKIFELVESRPRSAVLRSLFCRITRR